MPDNRRHLLRLSLIIIAFATAFASDSYSQNRYDSFQDSLKRQVVRNAYGHKWSRGSYKHRVPYRHIIQTPEIPDSADIVYHEKKNFWRGAGEVFGMNMGLWAFDRFALKGHYAYISWNTIKENFKHGFEWDDDHLSSNMFAHPYNGSMFFNAGRSNGFNFWQSELFAIGGSAMWEMCMECEYPSTNDIIATPVGGAAIGEVLYRTSDLIIDDRATGGERIGREVAAFVLDPMRGINRIISGKAWKKRDTRGRRFGLPPISVEASVGGRLLDMIDNEGLQAGPAAEVNIEYGDRFEESTKVPYDYFSFLLEFQVLKTQPLISRIEIMGRLLSKEIVDNERFNISIGLYQHYDYFDSDTIRKARKDELIPETVPYKLGTPASVGGGTMVRLIPNKKMSLDGFAHINLVALAGISTDFYRDYHRNYSWGMGYSIKAGINWALSNDKVSLKVANQFYNIITRNNFDSAFEWALSPGQGYVEIEGGDHSLTSFNHLEFSANYRLHKNIYLTAGMDFYTRHTQYKDMSMRIFNPPVISTVHALKWESKQLGAHLMMTYKF